MGDKSDQQLLSLKIGMDICTKTVAAVVSLNLKDTAALNAALDELRATMKGYINQEFEYTNQTAALVAARTKLRNMTDDAREKLGEHGVVGLFHKEEEKLKKRGNSSQKPENHNSMIAFEEEVRAQKRKQCGGGNGADASGDEDGDGDEELVMTQTTGSTLDPITRMPMTDPVKNVLCGHSYERASIQHLTRKGKKTKCPIAGCPNDQFVQMDQLIDNTDLKRQIERTKKK